MNLERLGMFLSIVDAGSMSAAAHRVHLTQPALSRNLQLLEDELGVELFERRGRGLVLTTAGRALVPQARSLLDAARAVAHQVSRSAARDYHDLRLGSIDSVATFLLPGAIERVRGAFPELAVKLAVGRSSSLLARIAANQLDLAVVAHSGPPRDVRSRLIGGYQLAYYGRADRFAAIASARRLAELRDVPMIEIEPAPGAPSNIPDGATTYAVATTIASVKALVLAGFGVGDLVDFCLLPDERQQLVRAAIPHDPSCGLYLAIAGDWASPIDRTIEDAVLGELQAALAPQRRPSSRGARKRGAGAANRRAG